MARRSWCSYIKHVASRSELCSYIALPKRQSTLALLIHTDPRLTIHQLVSILQISIESTHALLHGYSNTSVWSLQLIRKLTKLHYVNIGSSVFKSKQMNGEKQRNLKISLWILNEAENGFNEVHLLQIKHIAKNLLQKLWLPHCFIVKACYTHSSKRGSEGHRTNGKLL